jgi:hypothetical protein
MAYFPSMLQALQYKMTGLSLLIDLESLFHAIVLNSIHIFSTWDAEVVIMLLFIYVLELSSLPFCYTFFIRFLNCSEATNYDFSLRYFNNYDIKLFDEPNFLDRDTYQHAFGVNSDFMNEAW